MPQPPLKLPRIPAGMAITDAQGRITPTFQRWFNIDYANTIEEQEKTQQAEITRLNGVVTTLGVRLTQIEAAQEAANAAARAANRAQATADSALAGSTSTTARSGEATDPDVDLAGTGWVAGPQVNLLTVSAGVLTITGTTPLNNPGSHSMAGGLSMAGEYRVVEIVGGVDEVLLTGQFVVTDETTDEPSPVIIMSNQSAAAVQGFSSARASTGSVSYRMDMRRLSGATTNNLRGYLFARRE